MDWCTLAMLGLGLLLMHNNLLLMHNQIWPSNSPDTPTQQILLSITTAFQNNKATCDSHLSLSGGASESNWTLNSNYN